MKNIKKKLLSYGRSSVVVFLLFLSEITKAAVVDITAEYKPDISDLSHTSFRNTTITSGFCKDYPENCPEGSFSIHVPNIVITKRLAVGGDNSRQVTFGIKSDGVPRNITLTNTNSGEQIKALFRINLIDVTIYQLSTPFPVWYRGAIGGCVNITGYKWPTFYRTAWTLPSSNNYCYRQLASTEALDGLFEIRGPGLGYELVIDSPIGVGSGNYEGEVIYTLGKDADIDYYAESYSDDEIRFRITATVEHTFHMQFPSGSNRIQLEPSGGWGQWLNSGRMPAKMERNVDFSLTTSGPVSIALQCEQEMGTNCALRNQNTGEKVELETRVTLPGLKPLGGGAEVRDYRLATGPIKQFFIPEAYSYKRQSTVHFRVNQPHVETMLKQPGSQWAGNVTLMFEAGL